MKKLLIITFLINCILFIVIPDIANTSLLINLDKILPTNSFITKKFPFFSKFILNYIAIFSLAGVLFLYKQQYSSLLINKKVRLELLKPKAILLGILYIINHFIMYFGYLFNISYFNNQIETYRFHYFFDIKIGLFIYSWFAIGANSMIFSACLVSCLYLLKGVKDE